MTASTSSVVVAVGLRLIRTTKNTDRAKNEDAGIRAEFMREISKILSLWNLKQINQDSLNKKAYKNSNRITNGVSQKDI